MAYENFYFLFYKDLLFNISVLFFTIIIFLLIFKKYFYSLLDPFLIFMIFSSSGYALVFILFFYNQINYYYFIHFILTQLALTIGFLSFKPVNIVNINKKQKTNIKYMNISKNSKIVYFTSIIIYIFLNIFLYIKKGIPLFMESRLNATTDGYGLIASFINTTSIITLSVLSYKYLIKYKYNIIDYIFIFCYLIFTIFSGSKSLFLDSIFIFFYVTFYCSIKLDYLNYMDRFNKLSVKIFFIAFITLIFLLLLSHKDEIPLITIFNRVIMTGDVYMMAYVNNNIDKITGNFFNLSLPYKLIEVFKIDHEESIGSQLIKLVYGIESINGPNARHNIFGYVSFGYYGSIVFSFLIGLLIGFIRNKFIKYFKINIKSMILYVMILYNVLRIELDFNYAVFSYISIMFVYIVIFVISDLLTISLKK